MAATFKLRAGVDLRFEFSDPRTSTPTDPATISLLLRSPSGTVVTYAKSDMVRASAGVYTYTFTPEVAGSWKWQCWSTGSFPASSDGSFQVSAALF